MNKDAKEYKSYAPEHEISDVTDLVGRKLNSEVTDIDRFDSGYINTVYYAKLKDEKEVVIKVSPKVREWNQFKQEVWAYEKCRKVDVPTPQAYVHDDSRDELSEAYIIMERLPGISGDLVDLTEEQRIEISKQIGHYMSLIHSVKLNRFGMLFQQEDESFEGQYSNMWEYIYNQVTNSWWTKMVRKANLYTEVELAALIKRFEDNKLLFQSQQSSLVHGDLSMTLKNVMINDNKVSGIIDMEGVKAADPIEDLAYFKLWLTDDKFFKALQEGYDNKELFDENFEKKMYLYQLIILYSLTAYYHNRGYMKGVQMMKDKIPVIEAKLDLF